MNAQRRKALAAICNKIEDLKCEIETIMQDEQDAFDNLPEPLQETARGELMTEAIEAMENASNSIDEVMDYINEAIEK